MAIARETVRNPLLYAFLARAFGRVRVSKHGMPLRYRAALGAGGITVLDGGEEYLVCCPVCGDRRFRLSVNHMYGSFVAGVSMSFMAHCWNERCERRGLRDSLRREWENHSKHGASFAPWTETSGAALSDEPITLDGVVEECAANHARLSDVRPVWELPEGHPIRQYLDGRNFPSEAFGRAYSLGVSFDDSYPMRWAFRRLIVPVWMLGRQVGWQARVVDGFTPLTEVPGRMGVWPYREPR